MIFPQDVVVRGVKQSVWSMDGRSENTCQFFIDMPLKSTDDVKSYGTAVSTFNLGHSSDIDKYAHLTFPFNAKAQFELVTLGKKTETVLRELTPTDAKPAQSSTQIQTQTKTPNTKG